MADIIKPCPCCGERIPVTYDENAGLFIRGLRQIVCRIDRGGCGTSSGRFDTKREAVRAWNRRAKPA